MDRVVLTPDLPKQTAAFKRFEKTNVELNQFYWTFRCALEHIIPHMKTVKSVPKLVPGKVGLQLNITSAQFLNDYPQTERVARHSLLVLSVTAFEDYLKESLTLFLVRNLKPTKTYCISFRPQDIPSGHEIITWLRDKAIQKAVDTVLGQDYKTRFADISKLVIEHGASKPMISEQQIDLASMACEARNCIVHASAVVDSRAATTLAPLISGITKGTNLNVPEEKLWKLLGALRDSARALDVQLRVTKKRAVTK